METVQIVLAIESAIAGGSLSLLKNGCEIANWIGASNVSKAEDLLLQIDEILSSQNISPHDINLIAVSAGPGSFTGIRIGLATALGLKTGLGAKMCSVSAMHAIAFGSSMKGETIVAVPVGRTSVCLQRFNIAVTGFEPVDEPHTVSDGDLADHLFHKSNISVLLHPAITERIGNVSGVTNIDPNIAYPIGLLCAKSPGIVVEPLFISKSF